MNFRTGVKLLGLAAMLLAEPLAAQASLVILVRHAEKTGTAGDPGLTPAGEARAAALAEVLSATRLDAILTTEFLRTRNTAAPVAARQGLTPRVVTASKRPVPEHARAVAAALDSLPRGSAVLIVGHSNTLGHIIAALGGPPLPDLCDPEYATLFVLERGSGSPRLVRSRFGAPDPEGADRCGEGK